MAFDHPTIVELEQNDFALLFYWRLNQVFRVATLDPRVGRFTILDMSLALRQLLCTDRDDKPNFLLQYARENCLSDNIGIWQPTSIGIDETFTDYVCRFGVMLGRRAWICTTFREIGDRVEWHPRSYPKGNHESIVDEQHGFTRQSLNDYINTIVFKAQTEERNRIEVIKYVANKRGGVHHDSNRKGKEGSVYGPFDAYRTRIEVFAQKDRSGGELDEILGYDTFMIFTLAMLQHLTLSEDVWSLYEHSQRVWVQNGYPPLPCNRGKLVHGGVLSSEVSLR